MTVNTLRLLDTGVRPCPQPGVLRGPPDVSGAKFMIKNIAGDLHFWIPCAVLILGVALLVLLH